MDHLILPPVGSQFFRGFLSPIAATPSSTWSGYPIAYAYDGSTSTSWLCATGPNATVIFEFSGNFNPLRCDIICVTSGNANSGTITYYGSNDGVNWVQLADAKTRTFEGYNTGGNVFVSDNFDTLSYYKYIKIALSNSISPGIKEVKFYGTAIVSV